MKTGVFYQFKTDCSSNITDKQEFIDESLQEVRLIVGAAGISFPLRAAPTACSGISITSHYLGSATRDLQLILNLLAVQGCVATARRHSHLLLFN